MTTNKKANAKQKTKATETAKPTVVKQEAVVSSPEVSTAIPEYPTEIEVTAFVVNDALEEPLEIKAEVAAEPVKESLTISEELTDKLKENVKKEAVKFDSPKVKKAVKPVDVIYENDPNISGAIAPTHGYEGDIGWDLYTPYEFTIPPNGSHTVDTGICIKVPELPEFMRDHFQTATLFWSKSGLAAKSNVEKGGGLIDPGYTGNLVVHLYNHGSRSVSFKAGDKITQLFFVPALKVNSFVHGSVAKDTERGAKGFGSQG